MAKVCTWRTDQGRKAVIVGKPGTKYIPIVVIDYPVHLVKVPLSEQRYIEELPDYPIKKAVTKFRRAGRVLGITKTAKRFLAEI